MRDPKKTMAGRARQKQRAFLAAMIVATSPLMAEGPRKNTMPPLPLKASMQSNPFCLPNPKSGAVSNKIQLASGSSESTIRLKPIGAAIGLHEIGEPGNDVPRAVRPPAMTIEAIPSRVQTNPMIRSEHHANKRLVDSPIDDKAKAKSEFSVPAKTGIRSANRIPTQAIPASGRKSTITLIPTASTLPAIPAPVHQPVAEQPPQPYVPVPAQVAPVVTVPTVPAPVAQAPVATADVSAPVVATEPQVIQATPAIVANPVNPPTPKVAPVKKSEPVYFSMSDRFDESASETSIPETQQSIATADTEPVEVVAAPGVEANESVLTPVPAPSEELEITQDAVAMQPAGVEDSGEDSIRQDSESVTPLTVVENDDRLKPIESVLDRAPQEPIAVYQHAVTGPVDSPEETLHTKRYRPPVAVTPVPIVFERQGEEISSSEEASTSLVGSTVHSVDSIDLDGFQNLQRSKAKLTQLVLSRAQVKSLTLGGSVRQVKVANKNVCQAFASGPNQLKLIGTGNGVTRLVVWADSEDPEKPTRMRAFEVHVKDTVETTGDSVGNKASMLNQSIKKAFPRCNVRVRHQGDKLVVAGSCDSEASAKNIMKMVRKTCLVPTQDELVVR